MLAMGAGEKRIVAVLLVEIGQSTGRTKGEEKVPIASDQQT